MSQDSLTFLQTEHETSRIKFQIDKNKKVLEQAISQNEALKFSLKRLKTNLQTKTNPQHDKVSRQRKAIYQLLSYDKKLSLKQNYLIFAQKLACKKNVLDKTLKQLNKKNKQLLKNSINFTDQVEETNMVSRYVQKQKHQLQEYLRNLEHEKFIKLSIKQSQQSGKNLQAQQISIIISNPIDQPLNQSQTSLSCLRKKSKQLSQSPNSCINTQFHQHPDVFKQAWQIFDSLSINNKPKSKQILNSLEKQLNPLQLDEIIAMLQKQISYVKDSQYLKLIYEKQREQKKLQKLKRKQKQMAIKLQKMKIHLKKFKSFAQKPN